MLLQSLLLSFLVCFNRSHDLSTTGALHEMDGLNMYVDSEAGDAVSRQLLATSSSYTVAWDDGRDVLYAMEEPCSITERSDNPSYPYLDRMLNSDHFILSWEELQGRYEWLYTHIYTTDFDLVSTLPRVKIGWLFTDRRNSLVVPLRSGALVRFWQPSDAAIVGDIHGSDGYPLHNATELITSDTPAISNMYAVLLPNDELWLTWVTIFYAGYRNALHALRLNERLEPQSEHPYLIQALASSPSIAYAFDPVVVLLPNGHIVTTFEEEGYVKAVGHATNGTVVMLPVALVSLEGLVRPVQLFVLTDNNRLFFAWQKETMDGTFPYQISRTIYNLDMVLVDGAQIIHNATSLLQGLSMRPTDKPEGLIMMWRLRQESNEDVHRFRFFDTHGTALSPTLPLDGTTTPSLFNTANIDAIAYEDGLYLLTWSSDQVNLQQYYRGNATAVETFPIAACPSKAPTAAPTSSTAEPTVTPTEAPTSDPTLMPTILPSLQPTQPPSSHPAEDAMLGVGEDPEPSVACIIGRNPNHCIVSRWVAYGILPALTVVFLGGLIFCTVVVCRKYKMTTRKKVGLASPAIKVTGKSLS